ncbi:MAG: cobalt-precorrin-5B (C(1))-methyltransferase [Pedobacter sp.]
MIGKRNLRYGYTTGACAAAAAKGAAQMLVNHTPVSEVSIDLPTGVNATFQMHGQLLSVNEASCFVIKDAGDDPDVTNGAELHARVSLTQVEREQNILITGGIGIGKVTKPGLAVAPGEWAINPVPRRMITEAVLSVFSTLDIHNSQFKINVIISIPDGELRAKKTLNSRLGIMGGLSILGTTGIVRPISAKAWTDTIDAALDVAKACGCENVVLSTGRASEMAAQRHLATLPEEAFIMMGDHVAHALRACQQRSFDRPIVACQFAKMLKIACGYENTHAAASELDLDTLRIWGARHNLPGKLLDLISSANNTAREIIIASNFDPVLLELVCCHASQATRHHAPGIAPSFLAADYSGAIVYRS